MFNLKRLMDKDGTIRAISLETIQALVDTIEKKDPYTAGHGKRVVKYAAVIGKGLGLTEEELENLQLSALLHDIGKIGIEDSILLKNEKLTKEEFTMIKRHTIYGAEIIANIKHLNCIVPNIRSHHERYDGKGYPDGIKGENIPFIARILSVADSFDAMTSNRLYRNRMDDRNAINQIKNNVCTQFDPQIVKVFMNVCSNFSNIRREA